MEQRVSTYNSVSGENGNDIAQEKYEECLFFSHVAFEFPKFVPCLQILEGQMYFS